MLWCFGIRAGIVLIYRSAKVFPVELRLRLGFVFVVIHDKDRKPAVNVKEFIKGDRLTPTRNNLSPFVAG